MRLLQSHAILCLYLTVWAQELIDNQSIIRASRCQSIPIILVLLSQHQFTTTYLERGPLPFPADFEICISNHMYAREFKCNLRNNCTA